MNVIGRKLNMWQIIKCIFGNHGKQGMYCHYDMTVYYCLDCWEELHRYENN